jgi:hypothetical protein
MYIDGPFFKDHFGRNLMLRGINLSGNSKNPFSPNLASHIKFGNLENKISFVGRPFPLKQADEHFKRLKAWGLTFVRFLVTWEAIEHQGPGIYDEAYLDYVYEVIKKAQDYDIQVFIDPHQDVWSRFTGGDGAPRWTFEKVGLDARNFADSGAAILHQTYGDEYSEMIWPTNYSKLACATMFTLFFGGNDFAPDLKVDEIPIQEYLQTHYLNAIKQVAIKVKDLPNVVGFDTFNEPSAGWIGWQDLSNMEFPLCKGATPTPFQSMYVASGNPLQVDNWEFGAKGLKKKGKVELNPRGVRAWLSGFKCIWRQQGIWDMDKQNNPILLKPNYFAQVNGEKVDFNSQYLLPFIQRYSTTIREVMPKAIIFVEFPVNEAPALIPEGSLDNYVNAGHWYDVMTLFTKKFTSWFNYDFGTKKVIFGRKNVRKYFASQVGKIKKYSEDLMNNCPTLIGETGIPFDMHQKKAFINGNFTRQIKAMDATLRAIEDNLLNVTLWNYTPDNNNKYGDFWNKEDLSIFSLDQKANPGDLNSGGRALESLLRPYPIATAGIVRKVSFDYKKKTFEFEFDHDENIQAPTEIFIPNYQYPSGYKVFASDGEFEMDTENQKLIYKHSQTRTKHNLKIVKA